MSYTSWLRGKVQTNRAIGPLRRGEILPAADLPAKLRQRWLCDGTIQPELVRIDTRAFPWSKPYAIVDRLQKID